MFACTVSFPVLKTSSAINYQPLFSCRENCLQLDFFTQKSPILFISYKNIIKVATTACNIEYSKLLHYFIVGTFKANLIVFNVFLYVEIPNDEFICGEIIFGRSKNIRTTTIKK